jgi:signal transduction histidine kinase
LWWRRRWPVGLALALVALSTFSELVAGAMVVALFTVAVYRPPRTSLAVYGLSVLAALVYVLLRPEPGVPSLLLFLLGVAIQGAAVGWGLFIHYRRRLVESLRDRAARAETEAHLRAEQAQQRARDEIAREMHDVLGHRLSLLSVHAGALEFRPDADPAEIARAAKVIRENAHQALQDLREVIGVLRAPVGELPQPTLADVRQLVAESGRAGMRVGLREEVGGAVPDLVGRTAYRIVQEALTNARKHAPGAAVDVHLAGAPGQGLTVEVCNQPPAPRPPTPGRCGLRPVASRRPPAAPGPRSRLAGVTGPGRASPGWPSGSPWPTGGWSTAPPPRAAGGWPRGYPGRDDPIRAPDHRGARRRRRPPGAGRPGDDAGRRPDIRVVAEAGDGTQVLPLVDRHAPDVVPDGHPHAGHRRAGRHRGPARPPPPARGHHPDHLRRRRARAAGPARRRRRVRPQGHPAGRDRGRRPPGRPGPPGPLAGGDPAAHRPGGRLRPGPAPGPGSCWTG